MAFEWSCDIPLCLNSFPSPLFVCVFVSKKKKAKSFLNKLPVVFYTYMIAHISYYHYMRHLLREKKYLMRRSNETKGVKLVSLSRFGVGIIELST